MNQDFRYLRKLLSNFAYNYFPSNTCIVDNYDNYVNSTEIIKQNEIINDIFDSELFNFFVIDFTNKVKTDLGLELIDVTFHSSDRCLSFDINFFENDELHKLCINISLLVPYYFTYCLKTKIEINSKRWLSLPVRDSYLENKIYRDILDYIDNYISSELCFFKFNETLLNENILHISLGSKKLNDVTYYEAFFKEDSYL